MPIHTTNAIVCFPIRSCTITKRHKLALFAQLCYLVDGRNGRDHPDIEILIHNSSSQQAGENRLKQVFSGARGQLRSIVGATLVGSTMLLGSLTACAQDNSAPDTSSAPQTVATLMVADAGGKTAPVVQVADNTAKVYNAASTVTTPALTQNPYEYACEGLTEQEYKEACFDAANGTVVILRNPGEISDIVSIGFQKAVHSRYNGTIPVEFRDTSGSNTVFLFDKHMNISRDMLTNGSLLYVLGEKYPSKASKIAGIVPVALN